MSDVRKPIDALLREEGKMLERGAEMLECGETGESCSLNQVNTPEVNTTIKKRREAGYVAKANNYRF